MSEDDFWEIIEAVRAEAGSRMDDLEEFALALEERLMELQVEKVRGFAIKLDDLETQANSYELWGAAYVINGGSSEDGFLYFRRWLVAQGRTVWEAALADPESLAVTTPAGEDAEFEELAYIPRRVYERKAGRELLPSLPQRAPSMPSGLNWNRSQLPARYPRLTAKFS